MNSTELSPALAASNRVAIPATVAIAGAMYFAVVVAALHFVRPDLNPIRHPTSAYAVGQNSFLMTSAFFSMGVASLALVIALYQGLILSTRSRIGLAFLGAWAVGVLIAMLFPMDREGAPQTISGTIHQTAGPLTFLSLTAGMILVSWSFRQGEGWRPFFGTALMLSLLMLVAFIATFLSFATDSGTLGIAQRIALATALTWMLLTAVRIRSVAHMPLQA